MKINQLILNGHTYRYCRYENPQTSQTVIYMFGALQDIESVDYFSQSFSKDLNCISLELPGTGKTDVVNSTVSIQEQARMLLDFIEAMNIKSVHLIAFSYATSVALELCKIWTNVLSLSVCCGVPGVPVSGRAATQEILGIAMQRQPKEFAQKFTQSLTVIDANIPRNNAIIRATQRTISKMDIRRIDAFIENTIRLYVYTSGSLSDIKIPVTVLVGDRDPYVTPNEAKNFAHSFDNSRFLILNNADHLIHLQHPEKVSEIMIALASSSVDVDKRLNSVT